MNTTIRTKDETTSTVIRVYHSPMDFIADACEAGGKSDITGPRPGASWTSHRAGRTWGEYSKVFPTAYPEGRAMVEKYAKEIGDCIERPETVRRKPAWMEDEGEVCLDRALAGEDSIFRGHNRAKRVATKNISLVCNCTVSGGMSGNEVAQVAAGVAAAIERLEDSGYSVELWVVWHTRRAYRNGDNVLVACRVKECGEPLSMDILASTCSTDFSRLGCHGMVTSNPGYTHGLGNIVDVPTELEHWVDVDQGNKAIRCSYQKHFRLMDPLEQAKRIIREATEA